MEWVIDYLNFELISVIVSLKFRDRCGVILKSILNVMEKIINKKIMKFLEIVLEEMNKKWIVMKIYIFFCIRNKLI